MRRYWRRRVQPAAGEPLPPETLENLPAWIAMLNPRLPNCDRAFEVVESLLPDVVTSELPALDLAVRSTWIVSGWRNLDPTDVRQLDDRFRRADVIGAASSMNRNGHAREAAVRLLAASPAPTALRWLALRATDWVAPVQSLAQEACLTRVDRSDHLPALVDLLGLLDGLKFDGARRASELRTAAHSRLSSQDATPALMDGLLDRDRRVRRSAYRLLASERASVSLLERALQDSDVVSANVVADALVADPEQRPKVIGLLARSKLPPLRERAYWEAHLDPALPGHLEQGLFDRSPSPRRMAQRWSGNDRDALLERYRAAVGRGDHLDASLSSLAELGSADDAALASDHLDDERRPVRAAAIRLLHSHGGSDATATLLRLVLEESGVVAREAVRSVVARGVTDAVAQELYERASRSNDVVFTRVMRNVLPHGSKWAALRCGLDAAALDDAGRSALGWALVEGSVSRWNRSFRQPPPGAEAEIERLVTRLAGRRPALEAQLRFLFSGH